MSLLEELDRATSAVRAALPAAQAPLVGVVLGSGLGAWADGLGSLAKLPYGDIPHMPRSTVVGHAGNLCLGRAGDVPVACLQGRVHLYEGHDPERVVFGVRLLARLGCKAVLLTNAAGGLDAAHAPGDLMLIVDHLNLMGKNPLSGPNQDALGPRFPDMSEAYDRGLREAAIAAALEVGVPLQQGVYAGLLGPSYETPAEIRMLRVLGASAVGMSTVPEVIALRHMGVRAAAISCITNLAAGMTAGKLDHSEVEATANRTKGRFTALLSAWVRASAAALGREASR
ncbi:MAG: purine-nucleoside phosphorylase [Byssovorax sp.]